MAILSSTEILSSPIAAFIFRAALAAYVIYMARGFYSDPMNYFHKWMPRLPDSPVTKRFIRGTALFCIWGGCFILGTAIATQIFDLHGWTLALGLVLLAAVATPLLLPANPVPILDDDSGSDMHRS